MNRATAAVNYCNRLCVFRNKKWWPGTESNCRHRDFQSPALPTELPGRILFSTLLRTSCHERRTENGFSALPTLSLRDPATRTSIYVSGTLRTSCHERRTENGFSALPTLSLRDWLMGMIRQVPVRREGRIKAIDDAYVKPNHCQHLNYS